MLSLEIIFILGLIPASKNSSSGASKSYRKTQLETVFLLDLGCSIKRLFGFLDTVQVLSM